MKTLRNPFKVVFAGILCITLISFRLQNEEKKVKFEFTIPEVDIIYNALGKLPAEQVEQLRAKIVNEFRKQTDTTKHK